MMNSHEQQSIIAAEVIVGAWRDDDRRRALLANPAAVLLDAGLDLPDGVGIVVLEDTPQIRHVAIPHEVSEADKKQFAAELAAALPLPAGVELRLRQSTADEFVIVLPVAPEDPSALTEQELGLVVGGTGGNGGAGGSTGLLGGNGGSGGLLDTGLFGGNGGSAGWTFG